MGDGALPPAADARGLRVRRGRRHAPLGPPEGGPVRLEAPERRFLGGTLLLALGVRLAALVVWERLGLTERLGNDPYPHYAEILLGWLPPSPILTHPPVYTFWVAGLYALARAPSPLLVQSVNVLLGTAGVGLFALWARRRLPPTAARVAALWLALDPLLVYFSPQLQSEPLFVALLALFFLGVDSAGPDPRRSDALGLGLLGGVLTLTRSVVTVYPVFLVGSMLWVRRSLRGAAVWLLLFAGWAVPPTLWGLRNLHVHGQFIPLATNGGWTMWEGFTTDRDEVARRPYEMREEVARLGLSDEGDFFRIGRHFSDKLKAFVRENPLAAARIVAGKALLFWRPWVYDPYPVPVRWAAGVYFSALFLLAGFGAWSLRGDPGWAPVWALVINLSALHAVMFTSLRYRTPLEPFLVCLAAQGLTKLLPGARKPGV
ncbi:hypothetical protein EPO15_08875 [bacterium]|nr:MAG: hypothetical protein EPO15_08875 [bacterium]